MWKKLSQKISTVRLNSLAKTIIGVVNSGLIQYFDTLYLHKGLETYYLATLQSTSIDKKLEVWEGDKSMYTINTHELKNVWMTPTLA